MAFNVTEQDFLKTIGLCLQLGGEVRKDRCGVPDVGLVAPPPLDIRRP